MAFVDIIPRGPCVTIPAYDVEEQLLQSKFAEFLQRKLNLSQNHMKIEVLLEYALAFFLYPHFTGKGTGSMYFSNKDSQEENIKWIEAVIRPRLLENRKENIITLFNAQLEGEDEELINPTEVWHHIIMILSERYTLPEAAILGLKKDAAALEQYNIAFESSVVLVKKSSASSGAEKTVMDTLQLIMTLFVQPDINLDSSTPENAITWANYWFHINKTVPQPVQNLRSSLIAKTKLQYVHPEILLLILNEIRGINASGTI